jgi:hypothetical protein
MQQIQDCSRPRLADTKRLHRLLFGVYFREDLYDRLCARHPGAMRALHWRIPAAMRARNLIFIHVPRVAGTSIARALFGKGHAAHLSIRTYRALDPDFFAAAHSFAVLRDPFDHFASAYAYVRGAGTQTCRLADVFVAETEKFRGVDDYLSYLEDRDVLSLDFVMRPQSWFVCDRDGTTPLVKTLFLYGDDSDRLHAFLRGYGVQQLPWVNATVRQPLLLSWRQKGRIERLFANDFTLVEALRRRHTYAADEFIRIAAE